MSTTLPAVQPIREQSDPPVESPVDEPPAEDPPPRVRAARPATLRSARQHEQPATLRPAEEMHRRRSNRRRLAYVAAGLTVLLLIGAAATAYLSGAFTDEGRFDTAPKPCSLIDAGFAARIVPGGSTVETGDLCTVDSADPANGPKLTLTSNAAHSENRVSGPDVASKYLTRVFVGVGVRETGLGDEAISYQPPGSHTIIILMRVSNVLITLTGAGPRSEDPNAGAPADLVRDVAREAARRLRSR